MIQLLLHHNMKIEKKIKTYNREYIICLTGSITILDDNSIDKYHSEKNNWHMHWWLLKKIKEGQVK